MTRWGIICPTFIVGSNRFTDLVQSGFITCIRFCRRHQPSRLAWKAFHWRGIKYLRTLEALTGSQCHGRSFKVWRYEFQCTSILGDDWQNLALDSDQWQELKKRLAE